MSPLRALIGKEFRLLRRDAHALALLFVMPTFFILIMSLALRDVFAGGGPRAAIAYHLVNLDTASRTGDAKALAAELAKNAALHDLGVDAPLDRLIADVQGDRVRFVVVIPAGFGEHLRKAPRTALDVHVAPSVDGTTSTLFEAGLQQALARVMAQNTLDAVSPLLTAIGARPADLVPGPEAMAALINEQPRIAAGSASRRPTSVQQSVPAWLVFAMFFVSLPLSTTWLEERRQGTDAKLRSLGLSPVMLLIGKGVPYVVVNLLQAAVMVAVGVWIVPLFGGDALVVGANWPGLVAMALAVSVAAVSFGLMVAQLVATSAQAVIVTGASNLLLGALGGVMVPRLVMPPAMQELAYISPMAWGLEGFLDVLLRGAGVGAVLPKALALVLFGAVACTVGVMRTRRATSAPVGR